MFKISPASHPTHGGCLLYSGALLTLGAARIHVVVAPEHLREYVPFGLFFLVVGSAQVFLAVELLARPSRRLALVGAARSLALLARWAISRTTGLPIGPTPWAPEDIGLTDAICSAMEVGSTLLLLVLAARPARRRSHTGWKLALGMLPPFVLALALTGIGVAAATSEMPVAFSAAPAVPGQASTSVATLTETPGTERVDTFMLTAEVGRINGQEAWTFNGRVPGPELRVTQGDRVRVTLVNHLPAATTLHWHGLRVPNAEDGVAGLTQDAVPPGHTFTYEFVARDAGTYWYHSHQETEQQIPRGLFGALVVEPSVGHAAEDRDYTLVFHTAPGGPAIAVNGTTANLHLAARPGERVRLRLINAIAPSMDGSPEAPVLLGASYQVVALDGHDLHAPQALGPERLPLGMGQRADVVFTTPPGGAVELIDSQLEGQPSLFERFSATASPAETVTIGDGQLPEPTDPRSLPLFDPTTYGTAAADPAVAGPFDVTVPVVLDEGPGFRDGRPELVHTLNGQASPNVPPITVREGALVRLHLVNNSGEYHPMHLHGHVMSVLARDGRPIRGSPLHLDTVLVGPHQSWDVAFAADNPGIRMFHCHVLLHAAYGMSLTVNYAGISTPYEMGSRSGNVPE